MFIDFREEEGERQRETSVWERNVDRWHPIVPDQGSNLQLGMCPAWESNPQPFGVWVNAPTNWATQPVLNIFDIF